MHVYNSVSSTNTHSLGFNWQSFSPFTQYALLFFLCIFPLILFVRSHEVTHVKNSRLSVLQRNSVSAQTQIRNIFRLDAHSTHTHATLNSLFLQHCSICINTLYPLHKPYDERNSTCVSPSKKLFILCPLNMGQWLHRNVCVWNDIIKKYIQNAIHTEHGLNTPLLWWACF